LKEVHTLLKNGLASGNTGTVLKEKDDSIIEESLGEVMQR
jgi:hypothetical protein